MVEDMRLQAVVLLDPIAEESWLSWVRRHDLMPTTEAECVRAVQAEEERQRQAEEHRWQQEDDRRVEVAARQRAALAVQHQAALSQSRRASRVASVRRPRVESVGEDVEMLSDAGPATQGEGSAVKKEKEESVLVHRDVALSVLFLLTIL
jgi:hypothetical protein